MFINKPIKTRDEEYPYMRCSNCGEIHFTYTMCTESFEIQVFVDDHELWIERFNVRAYTFDTAIDGAAFNLTHYTYRYRNLDKKQLYEGVLIRIGKAGVWKEYNFKLELKEIYSRIKNI